jgi:hypothetical protein
MARRTHYNPADRDEIIALRAEGVLWSDISKKLNLREASVVAAYEEGVQDPGTAPRLVQIYDTLQNRLLYIIRSFTDEQVTDLAPDKRAIVFGIMADKIAPLQKVIGDSTSADGGSPGASMSELLAQAQNDLAPLNTLIDRLKKKKKRVKAMEAAAQQEEGADVG